MIELPKLPDEIQHPDQFPVPTILEILQTSEHPDLQAMTDDQWWKMENALNDPVRMRYISYRPATLMPSDQKFTLSFPKEKKDADGNVILDADGDPEYEMYSRRYRVRKMDSGDVMDVAGVGPQLVETFFGGKIEDAAQYPIELLATHLLAESIGQRFKMCMHELAEWIMVKLCSLAYDMETKQLLDAHTFRQSDPSEGTEAIQKILAVNNVFFSTLTQRIPANFREVLSSLTGMISLIGNPLVEEIISEGLQTKS